MINISLSMIIINFFIFLKEFFKKIEFFNFLILN